MTLELASARLMVASARSSTVQTSERQQVTMGSWQAWHKNIDQFGKMFLAFSGWDLILGMIATFYVLMVPYTKVEESFNIQAMHDILYHQHNIENYDHLEFPGVVPRTFLGALIISIMASPVVYILQLLHLPKLYSLIIIRMVLGCIVLSAFRLLQIQVRRKFGLHVEVFFVILTAVQFHMLFYSTRPLPNILAFALVTLAYSFWFEGNSTATLICLTIATVIFRCDTVLLLGPIGLELLLSKSISLWQAAKCGIITTVLSIGLTVLVDSIMWKKLLWPEFEVFWFNSVLNRSSEWGTYPFHWYFTSALPRSLLVAYPLSIIGIFLDRRILRYIGPAFTFVLLYSKLPHKELRFIIGALPIFNVSAAIAASRIFNNRRKNIWRLIYIALLGCIFVSLGCSIILFLASYNNYPGAFALEALHQESVSKNMRDKLVHIDPYAAMNGISRFVENGQFRYSKEEGITLDEYQDRNFTFLLNEHSYINGFKCLFAINGFSSARVKIGFPPITLVTRPKVFIHGSMKDKEVLVSGRPGCP